MIFPSTKRKTYIRYAIVLAVVIFVSLTYILLKTGKSLLNSGAIFALVYLDIAILIFISSLMYWQIKAVLNLRSPEQKGRLFHKQIISLFSLVTILPSVCVFAFSMLFFNIGIENLFKSPVKNVIENAEQVAEIYINDMKVNLESLVNVMRGQINNCIDGFAIDHVGMKRILAEETENSKVDASVIQNVDGDLNIIASTPFALAVNMEKIPSDIVHMENGEIISWEVKDSAMAATIINKNLGIYLIASAPIDGVILKHKHKIKAAVAEYSNLATQRAGVKVSFMTLFSVVTIFLLLTSIFFGVIFANRILKPINKLITATKNVTAGDYKTPIQMATKTKTEFDVLIETFNDMISKLEQQKQQLIISNKQNAWRDIARKIAHEIKNPLTPIQLSAERLKNKYQKEIRTNPEVFNSCIETIIRQVQCIGNLVKEFSDFARMPAPKIEKVDIIELIKQVVFIQANAHKNIRFEQNYDRTEFFCHIDQAQINQVIMNLLQNSINAIVENNPQKDPFNGNIEINFYVKDGMICLSIEDDGPGFKDSVIDKVLEPYYTTREKGTGLGLAIVHKIITDHNGEISLGRSEKLGGAKVLFEIPDNYSEMKGGIDGI